MTTLIPELEARPLGVSHVWPRERALLCLAVGLLAVLVPLIAIDGRSFWIDEFGTWRITQHAGIREWALAFVNHPNSDGQMPLYHFYMFWWVKAFGGSELAMRLANLPLFATLCIAIGLAPVSARLRLIWLAVITLHAFLWYYLNEARPYLHAARRLGPRLRGNDAALRRRPLSIRQATTRFRSGVVRRWIDPHGRRQYPRRAMGRFDTSGDRLCRARQDRGSLARRPDHLAGHSRLWRDINRDPRGCPS